MTTHKEEAARMLEASKAAEQKTGKGIMGGVGISVNAKSAQSMLDSMRAAGLGPLKDIDLVVDGGAHRCRVACEPRQAIGGAQ